MKYKKKIITVFIITFLLIILFFIPEIYVSSIIDKKELKKKVETFLENSSLSISYDGLSVSAYRGIALYQVRISAEKDFSRGRTFIFVPELIIPLSFTDIYHKQIKLYNLKLDNAIIKIWIEKKAIVKDLSSQIQNWIKQFTQINIEIRKSKLYLNLRKSYYEKEKWIINNFSTNIKRTKQHFSFSANIDDVNWGNFQLEFNPLECFLKELTPQKKKKLTDLTIIDTNNTCKWWMGHYKIHTKEFPLSKLSWWIDNWNITKGYLNSSFTIIFENMSKVKNRFQLKVTSLGNFQLSQLSVYKNKRLFLSNFDSNFNINYKRFKYTSTLNLSGNINDYLFEYSDKKNQYKLWADEIHLKIKNSKKTKQVLHLPYNMSLSGLNFASFDLNNSKYNIPYRYLSSKILIDNGELNLFNNKIKIPQLSFNLDKNNYTLESKINFKNSDFKIDLEGYLKTRQYEFVKSLFMSYTSTSRIERTNSVFFFSNHIGSITSDYIQAKDFKEIYLHLYHKWHHLALDAYKAYHRENNIHQNKIFKDFFSSANANIQFKINHWKWNNQEKHSAQGSLIYRNKISFFNIKDDVNNYLTLTSNFIGNYPIFKLETKIKLENGYPYFTPFFDKKVIQSFKGIEFSYTGQASGEWAYTIFHSHKSEGYIKIFNVLLGRYFIKKDNLPSKWKELSFRIKRYGPNGIIYDILAKNNFSQLSGNGQWRSQYLEPKWYFSYKIKLLEKDKE